MPKLNYGQAFEKVGITTLGGRGTLWCGLAPTGVLVLMAHKNYFRKFRTEQGQMLRYVDPGAPVPSSSHPVQASLNLLEQYFQPGKPIILLEAEMKSDGGPAAAAAFDHATGKAFNARFISFQRPTGRIECASDHRVDL